MEGATPMELWRQHLKDREKVVPLKSANRSQRITR